jgi:hypothetical protein
MRRPGKAERSADREALEPGPELMVDGFSNARDLGGLPRPGGGLAPFVVFIRSDQPDLLEECPETSPITADFGSPS